MISHPDIDVVLMNPPYSRRIGGGIVPPIGLCYLAAQLERMGARSLVVDLAALYPHTSPNFESAVSYARNVVSGLRPAPKLVGIGPLVTATLSSTHAIVRACRDSISTPIVVGGALCAVPGFGSVAEHFLGVDAYVAGDGETPISCIWESLSSSGSIPTNIPGVWTPGAAEPSPFRQADLDQLPIPARHLLEPQLYRPSARRGTAGTPTTAAFLSRGCPYSCSFCSAPLSSGKVVRRFSPSRITQELQGCSECGFDHIVFYDDCLFIRSPQLNSRVLEFINSIIESGWLGTFQLELRCDAVCSLTDDALAGLASAGFRQINMGIQKAQASRLQQLRKRLTPEVARKACERVSSFGIRAAATFILGGPGETIADLRETVAFAESLSLDFAHFNPLALYPGTTLFAEIFGQSRTQDWLDLCLDPELAPHGDILWADPRLPIDLILACISDAYRSFYSESRLREVLSRLPLAEHDTVRGAYALLADHRPTSWPILAPPGARSEHGVDS